MRATSEEIKMQNEPTGDGTLRRVAQKARFVLPVLLCLVYVGQCLWFIGTQSLTSDEPIHIIAGLEAWRQGRFERWNDHPPLLRLLFTIPLLHGDWQIERERGTFAQLIRPSPEAMAWRVRSLDVGLGLLLGILLWRTARRLYSEGAANFALALFAFSPALIAHFSLAVNDGAVALLTFAAALELVAWRRSPSRLRAAILGLILGALLVVKFSTPPLFALALGLVLILRPGRVVFKPQEWNWGQAATVVAIAFLVVWGVHFFHVTKVTVHDHVLTAMSPHRSEPFTGTLRLPLNLTLYLPAGEYLEGLWQQVKHTREGHPSFFLGQVSKTGGWKLYFPAVIGLKWPTIVLATCVATALLAIGQRVHLPRDFWLLSVFPGVFFLIALFSSVNIGERHILLVYPFVLLFAAGIWQFARLHRAGLALLLGLVFLNAADGLRYAPDYLSYFTVFVKPENSYRLLTDSNLDWGQGLIALRNYQAEHPDETIHLAYFGTVDPALYGVRYVPLLPGQRVSGTVVVSATHLSGQLLRDPNGYRWTLELPRKAIVNHTLHVFEAPQELVSK